MNKQAVDYVRSVRVDDLPDGMEVLREGIKMGQEIEFGRSPFLDECGYKSYAEYKRKMSEAGKVPMEVLMGLATLEDQIEGIRRVYEHGQRTGFDIRTIQCIPSFLMALPEEYRENAPKPTSYVINSFEDYMAHQQGLPIQILFEDQTLSCPNAIETTKNALKFGSARTGMVSQFIWDQPGYTDRKQHVIDMIKSIGMVASKKDQDVVIDTFMDDGFPGYAMDHVTYVGYALLEYYVVHDLCGANFQISGGNLVPQIVPRMAITLALHKLRGSVEEPVIGYMNGVTISQWDHDIESNYAPAAKEMLMEILFERKYHAGVMINPVSITEKVTVPTVDDLINIYSLGARLQEDIDEWDELINWEPIEKMADLFAEEGQKFFENALEVLKEAGVNIEDPLDIMMTLKNVNASKFEATFHHNLDEYGVVIPIEPTVMGRQTLELKDEIVKEIKEKGLKGDELEGIKLCLVSGDGHSYGLVFMDNILREFGAEVVNGGVDIDAATLLDLADEEGVDIIGVSVHNGQGLDYAKALVELGEQRDKKYNVFLGGRLNGILPGESEPTDVSQLINDLGVYANNDLYEEILQVASWK